MTFKLMTVQMRGLFVFFLLLISANAAGNPNDWGTEKSPVSSGDKTFRGSEGGPFSLTLNPNPGPRASTGGVFQLVGSFRSLEALDLVFADSFESGDTAAWSATIPPPVELPSGAVVFFDATECPAGWSFLYRGEGRGIVGSQPGGDVWGVQGAAMPDLSSPIHYHTISGSFTAVSAGSHNHWWAYLFHSEMKWSSYTSDYRVTTLIDWSNGIDNAGSGIYPFAVPGFSVDKVQGTSNVSSHNHAVSLYHSSGPASAAMPYLQLLGCEKD